MLRHIVVGLLVLMVVVLAGCTTISALEPARQNIVRPPEILLPGPYEPPVLATLPAVESAVAAPVLSTSDHLRDLDLPVARPVLSTADILRGVY